MVSAKMTITNPTGLHLEAAETLCERAMLYHSHITISCNTATVNAKSVLGLLGAGINTGDEVEIFCSGDDEDRALADLCQLLREGLN